MKKSFLLFGACALLSIGTAFAQAPAKFNYQGIVRDASGNALSNQAVQLRISILDNSATGTVVYRETQTTTTNAIGLYTLAIGSGTPVTGTLGGVNWASGDKFIQVEIDPAGGTSYVDLGTSQLLSVPYALNSPAPTLTLTGNTLSAGGNSVTLPSGGGGGISGTVNYVPKFATATTLGNSSIVETTAGKIGIGTTTPGAAKVEIATADTMALRVTSNSPAGANGGVLNVEYTGTNTTGGVAAVIAAAIPSATAAAGIGMYGQGGLLGVYGVGQANVSTGNVFGTRGEAYSNGNAYGLYGSADSYSGTPGGVKYGTVGVAGGGTTNVGILGGTATGAAGTNYAGYFNGNVQVVGSIAKSSGTFKIDHPQDPENKYLYHSFVESPDMMNVYNGNTTTDASGYATVTLPGYFESLNKDFRYQLTVVGGTFAQAIVSQKVKGNTFQIRTSEPGTEVSWQVTGIRNDAYANAHRVQAEVEKEAENKGRYLNPAELGKSTDLQIGKLELPAPIKAVPRK